MKTLLIISILFVFPVLLLSQEMTGKIYQYVDAPPWAMSEMIFDTAEALYEYVDLNDVELKVIINYDRFAEDGKGKGYEEFYPKYNKDGSFSIDLSRIEDGQTMALVGIKEGYLKLWNIFTFCKKCNYKNVKVIFVSIRNFKK